MTPNVAHLAIFAEVRRFLFLCLSLTIFGQCSAATFETGYIHHTVYTEGEFTDWQQGEAIYRVSERVPIRRFHLGIAVTDRVPNGAFVRKADRSEPLPEQLGPEHGKLYGRAFYLDRLSTASVALDLPNDRGGIAGRIEEREGPRDGWQLSGYVSPVAPLRVSLIRGLRSRLPQYTEASYEYYDTDSTYAIERRRVDWLAPLYYTGLEIQMGDTGSLAIFSRHEDGEFRPREPLVGEGQAGELVGIVDGLWQDEAVEGILRTRANVSVYAGLRRVSLDGRTRVYDAGRRFGYFGITKFSAEYWYFGLEWRRWRARYYHGYGNGEIAGTVQLWPFLEGILRYLGERRHLIAKGGGDANFMSLDYAKGAGDRICLKLGLDWFQLEPYVNLVSWRPLLFGIGVDDLRGSHLKLQRADLIRLRFGTDVTLGRFVLHTAVSQWAPLAVKKEEKPGPPVPTVEGESSNNIWGGFTASASLSLRL